MSDDVLYEEVDGIATVAINRPEKKNTLTEGVIRGIADGIDAAARSKEVAAVVLRGVGDTFAAGYDLTDGGDWDVPLRCAGGRTARGVRGIRFGTSPSWANNVKRFMRIWECPKPVLGEIRGWAIGGATDLALCCDQLYMASDAHIGYAPSRIYGAPTTMLWVYRLGLEHAKQFLLTGRAIDAGTAHRIGLVAHVGSPRRAGWPRRGRRAAFPAHPGQSARPQQAPHQPGRSRTWGCAPRSSSAPCSMASRATRRRPTGGRSPFSDKGFREVIRERDAPWQDYGERPKPKDD